LYDAWGNIRYVTGTLPTDIAYTGQRLDSTGLVFLGARYYSPSVGRFVSADTIVPNPKLSRDFNRYAYGGNNPITLIDMNGHQVPPQCSGSGICSAGTGGPYVVSITGPEQQPLTVGTSKSETDVAYTAAPDDGALLLCHTAASVVRRNEVVQRIEVRGGVGSGGAEFRHVRLTPFFGADTLKEFDQVAANGSIGVNVPVIGKLDLGLEGSYGGEPFDVVPSASANILGGEVSIQPNQAMAGYVNPVTGMGARSGPQWSFSKTTWALTSRQTLSKVGGEEGFAMRYIDDLAECEVQGYLHRNGRFSGLDRLRFQLTNAHWLFEEY
jgi:RHS repeat-associated protein